MIMAESMNLPAEFEKRTQGLLGEKGYEAFRAALSEDVPVSVRVNTDKYHGSVDGEAVGWCTTGYYLHTRPTFTFDPLFHAGCYYVQEASSMFVEQALRQYVHHPVVMLDLCAAPGGKSTLARSVLPAGSLLIANEVMRNRSQILAENLTKWGHSDVIVTNNDPQDFSALHDMFDVILTDVPCSGEGMFRKDQVAVDEWSTDNVELCWKRQRSILTDIWDCLKPGGLLIYSTCTFNTEENEENVDWIARHLGAEVLPVTVDESWNITGNLWNGNFPVYRFLPHRTVGEGFFLAVLRKHGNAVEQPMEKQSKKEKKGKNAKNAKPVQVVPQQVKLWIADAENFLFEVEANRVLAIKKTWKPVYDLLNQHLKILQAGVELAENKGKDWIPQHALALSDAFCADRFPQAELSYQQAVAYLRKESVVLDASVPRGYVCVTYQGIPLGFVKNIGNRANNLYPQEWRIRSGYMPEEVIFALG